MDITIFELGIQLPAPEDEVEVVIHVDHRLKGESPEDVRVSTLTWSYYMVDHRARSIFWLRKYDIDRALFDEIGFSSPDHASAYTSVPPFCGHTIA